MRLPKPRKRGDSYRIEIMLDGKRLSATRDTAKECTIWASQKILEYKAGLIQSDKSRVMSFVELIKLYHEKAGKDKGAKDTEAVMQTYHSKCNMFDNFRMWYHGGL